MWLWGLGGDISDHVSANETKGADLSKAESALLFLFLSLRFLLSPPHRHLFLYLALFARKSARSALCVIFLWSQISLATAPLFFCKSVVFSSLIRLSRIWETSVSCWPPEPLEYYYENE